MNAALVDAARAYLGAPFKHQGRAPHGMDCGGLLILSLSDIGRNSIDIPAYGRHPWKDGLEQCALENFAGCELPKDEPLEPGDIVLAASRPFGPARHLAIVSDHPLGELGLIHTRSDIYRGQEKGRVVEHILDARWRSLIIKAFRL